MRTYFSLLAVAGLILIACGPALPPIVDVTTEDLPNNLPGAWGHIAWYDQTHIASLYFDSTVYIYDFDSEQWNRVQISRPEGCVTDTADYLARTPLNTLSVEYQCYLPRSYMSDSGMVVSHKTTLYQWDESSQALIQWKEFPLLDNIFGYSFAPDMSRMFLEDYCDKTYDIAEYSLPELVLPNYYRVILPQVSPDGKNLAFVGNETAPFSPFEIDLCSRPSSPWNVYVMDLDTATITLRLTDLLKPDSLKWSPNGKYLTFESNYLGQ